MNSLSKIFLPALFIILLAGFCQGGGHIDFDKMTDIDFQQMNLAEQGYAAAQNYVGVMHYNGGVVAKDEAEAAKWFLKAATQGNMEAQRNLKSMAEAGNATAQNYIGYLYESGKGVPQDAAEAVKWYRKATDQGNAEGQWRLGYMYADGKGVVKDVTEALKWYRKAAEQGNAASYNSLFGIYEFGHGVPVDHAEAEKWYQKSKASQAANSQFPGTVISDAIPAAKSQYPGTVIPATKPNSPPLVDPFMTTPAVSAKPLARGAASAPPVKTDNQPTSSATIYLHILQAGLGVFVLALITAFLISKEPSSHLKSKPITGWLSFFCGVLICLGPIFSLGQLEIDRQRIASSISPEMLTTLALEALGITAFMIYGVFIGVKIWRRSPRGVQLARRYLLVRLIALPAITICALMFMPPLPNKVMEAFGGGFMVAIREMIIVGAWWLYFAKSKNVKETYAITQASLPPLPGKEEKAGIDSAVYGINQNRKKEKHE